MNWYAYGNGDPQNFVDPSGLATTFGSLNGQYEITTSNGKVYKNSTNSKQLYRDLGEIEKSGEKINNITFGGTAQETQI